MGFYLRDFKNRDGSFSTNFWNWHAIVEVIRLLNVLPEDKVESLHEPFCGNGLSAEEARLVALSIRTQILPRLDEVSRIYSNGSIKQTDEPDNGMNGVSFDSLERLVGYLERSNGFELI